MKTTTVHSGGEIAGRESVPADSALLDVDQIAALCRCSVRHIYRLADAGRIPRPIKLGALVRWRRGEMLDWIATGCPPVLVSRGGSRG